MLDMVHNGGVGHGGVERTLKKLADFNLSWPNIRQDVQVHIPVCLLSEDDTNKITYQCIQIYNVYILSISR